MLLVLLMLLMAPMAAPLARNPTLCSEIFLILGRSSEERVWYNIDPKTSNIAV